MNKSQEITTLGGRCFWCLEALFSELCGVENVVSGYSGGSVPNPSYQQICTGATAMLKWFRPHLIQIESLSKNLLRYS